jgi:hypothetical protein
VTRFELNLFLFIFLLELNLNPLTMIVAESSDSCNTSSSNQATGAFPGAASRRNQYRTEGVKRLRN